MKHKLSIIGGGSAGLFLAAFLDPTHWNVTIYEKNKTLGRKFLVAGNGGFNLTHSESMDQLIQRYSPTSFLEESLSTFTNIDFQKWLKEINIPTFVGSSRRIFPEQGIKPIEVLNSVLALLQSNNVEIHSEQEWSGWEEDQLIFNNNPNSPSDITVFALGGGSWKVTGSTGDWLPYFQDKGIQCQSFYPSNCGYAVDWPTSFIKETEGLPLKDIAIRINHVIQKGELVITQHGLEGNAIYALSPEIRSYLIQNKPCEIKIDLKPNLSLEKIIQELSSHPQENTSQILRKHLNLNQLKVKMIKTFVVKEDFINIKKLALCIKGLPILLRGTSPIDEAISTVGGIELSEVDRNFELKKIPHFFCIGEMLDWDAPTGGYLLQGCASMAYRLAKHLNNHFIADAS